jgi:hypothetical protein
MIKYTTLVYPGAGAGAGAETSVYRLQLRLRPKVSAPAGSSSGSAPQPCPGLVSILGRCSSPHRRLSPGVQMVTKVLR